MYDTRHGHISGNVMSGRSRNFAEMSKYAGDVSVSDAWNTLKNNIQAVLVDVRTQVEWQLIGVPDLSSIGKEPICLEWMTAEGKNPEFIDQLVAEFERQDISTDAPLLFMCRSGGRSQMAAIECMGRGYSQCFNIVKGYEGDLDSNKHRNSLNGWRYEELPWVQN